MCMCMHVYVYMRFVCVCVCVHVCVCVCIYIYAYVYIYIYIYIYAHPYRKAGEVRKGEKKPGEVRRKRKGKSEGSVQRMADKDKDKDKDKEKGKERRIKCLLGRACVMSQDATVNECETRVEDESGVSSRNKRHIYMHIYRVVSRLATSDTYICTYIEWCLLSQQATHIYAHI